MKTLVFCFLLSTLFCFSFFVLLGCCFCVMHEPSTCVVSKGGSSQCKMWNVCGPMGRRWNGNRCTVRIGLTGSSKNLYLAANTWIPDVYPQRLCRMNLKNRNVWDYDSNVCVHGVRRMYEWCTDAIEPTIIGKTHGAAIHQSWFTDRTDGHRHHITIIHWSDSWSRNPSE